MQKLRFVRRLKNQGMNIHSIEYEKVLQEAVEISNFGGIKTYEWHDVPCIMDADAPPKDHE